MPSFISNFSQLPGRSKAILGGTAVGILLLVFFMLKLAGAPSYTTLSSGLKPADTGKMTAALDAQGIGYELQANGTALAVQKADVAKARIALAGAGVAAGAGSAPGFEVFDKPKLGASEFQQKVTYQRALEGEITNAINTVQGVSDAKVQLVMPEEDLFVDESSPATASVALGNTADTLEPGAARGIAQMVSSSVKGLKPANVTITDSTGQVMWPSGDGSGGGGAAGSLKAAAQERYARSVEARINSMLDRTLGPGKAMVQVQADLNMDKTTKNELVYAKTGVPLKAQKETERLRGTGAGRAGGSAGTGSNIPSYSSGAGGSGNSNYQRKSGTTEFGVDKTVSKTDVAQGAVNRLQVALLLDKSVAAAGAQGGGNAKGLQAIQDSVAAAAGLDTARGDTITATQLAFAKPPVATKPSSGPIPAGLAAQVKWLALGLGTLIFLFFMWRHMRRRERDALPQPEWLSQIDQPVTLAELEAGDTRPFEPLPDREVEPGLLRLEQLMEREPEKVAAQVRQWMTEE